MVRGDDRGCGAICSAVRSASLRVSEDGQMGGGKK